MPFDDRTLEARIRRAYLVDRKGVAVLTRFGGDRALQFAGEIRSRGYDDRPPRTGVSGSGALGVYVGVALVPATGQAGSQGDGKARQYFQFAHGVVFDGRGKNRFSS